MEKSLLPYGAGIALIGDAITIGRKQGPYYAVVRNNPEGRQWISSEEIFMLPEIARDAIKAYASKWPKIAKDFPAVGVVRLHLELEEIC